MAAKEATVFIIDLGPTMAEQHQGRKDSDLSFAMRYVWDKIFAIVATERKTLNIGVVGLNTAETKNALDSHEGYEHISVLQPLGQMQLPDISHLRTLIRPHKDGGGADSASAIVVAIDMISSFCRHLKYKRKIVLITNGKGIEVETDSLDQIVQKVNEEKIELVVLGVDFDDKDGYGFVEHPKDHVKATNEKILSDLCNACEDGMFATLAEAIDQLASRPQLRTIRPVGSSQCQLVLGDPSSPENNNLSIGVERYPRVMPERVPTAGSYVLSGNAMTDVDQKLADLQLKDITNLVINDPSKLAAVKQARTYAVDDSTAEPKSSTVVPFADLARGFEYGSTIVHISESDMNVVLLPTTPAIDIVGFVRVANLPPYFCVSKTNVIVPSKVHFQSQVAFSALLQSLYQTETAAIARFVPKNDKPPSLVALIPSIDPSQNTDGNGDGGGNCLVEIELPFAEDIRPYKFPPLDRVYTKVKQEEDNAASMSKSAADAMDIDSNADGPNPTSQPDSDRRHYLPTPELQDAIDAFVDDMEIPQDIPSNEDVDDLGSGAGAIPSNSTTSASLPELYQLFNPLIHRYRAAIRARALDPDCDPVAEATSPPPYPLTYAHPAPDTLDRAKQSLDRLIAISGVTVVPPKDKTWKKQDPTAPIDVLDLDDLADDW